MTLGLSFSFQGLLSSKKMLTAKWNQTYVDKKGKFDNAFAFEVSSLSISCLNSVFRATIPHSSP